MRKPLSISPSRIVLLIVLFLVAACATQKKLDNIKQRSMTAKIALPQNETKIPELDLKEPPKDTIQVDDFEGRKVLIMRAVKDENGDMVATDVIKAAVVTARFRNVVERKGKVQIEFQVIVPKEMQDSHWQLRFYPMMHILQDSVALDPVIITGKDYRKEQLKGYQQYDKFLSKIVSDTTKFINLYQLEVFIERNIPQLYGFKSDSSYVSDEQFASIYGVTQKEAIDHYTNKFMVNRNNGRKARRAKMFAKYVKAPIVKEGLKLDTVVVNYDGDFVYNYIQTFATRPKLRKVDIVLSGHIYKQNRQLYTIPRSEPLTFYISSLSAFVDNTEHYKSMVIERRAEANTACYIDFASAKSDIDLKMSNNAEEIGRIKGNIRDLLLNKTFDLDSIVVTASCSPEGGYDYNAKLAQQRSESVSTYFDRFIAHVKDSVEAQKGLSYNLDNSYVEKKPKKSSTGIRFISRSNPENWSRLDVLVSEDTTLTEKQHKSYDKLSKMSDLDAREHAMKVEDYYPYMLTSLYPKLRTVKFDFQLHRKGMIKDTIHTTVLDSAYMDGVQAIRDHDYKRAIELLRPYNDYNTAIAYCAMDYNASAMAILKNLDRTAQVNYMLAVLYSRKGDYKHAVECYLKSCKQNPSYVHRGNLDPEISLLIKSYGLNKEE
jgi:hypothetical protein